MSERRKFPVGHPFPVTVAEHRRLEQLQKELDDAADQLDMALRQQNMVRLRLALRHIDAAAEQMREFRRSFVETVNEANI